MEDCEIRLAVYEDIPVIMRFIDQYWKKGHILALNRELFEWQYTNDQIVNMVIGIDHEGNIQGILGFIPYGNGSDKDIALALWKANQVKSFLGIRLLAYLKKEVPHRNIVCTGINLETTSKIYLQMGMTIGTMTQWYRLSSVEKFKIAKVEYSEIPKVGLSKNSLQQLKSFEETKEFFELYGIDEGHVPFKSAAYICKRYFNHPIYKYLIYGVKGENGKNCALIVLRIQEYRDAKTVRFVDCVGSASVIQTITTELDQIMIDHGAEYIDLYETGLNPEKLKEAGWIPVKESGNIIPNYFSPYEQRIIDIHYCTSDKNAVLFRGDGDQDRPS